jgi:hypothetical protein
MVETMIAEEYFASLLSELTIFKNNKVPGNITFYSKKQKRIIMTYYKSTNNISIFSGIWFALYREARVDKKEVKSFMEKQLLKHLNWNVSIGEDYHF